MRKPRIAGEFCLELHPGRYRRRMQNGSWGKQALNEYGEIDEQELRC